MLFTNLLSPFPIVSGDFSDRGRTVETIFSSIQEINVWFKRLINQR